MPSSYRHTGIVIVIHVAYYIMHGIHESSAILSEAVHAQVSYAHLPCGQGTWAWTASAAAGPSKLLIQTFELYSLFCVQSLSMLTWAWTASYPLIHISAFPSIFIHVNVNCYPGTLTRIIAVKLTSSPSFHQGTSVREGKTCLAH